MLSSLIGGRGEISFVLVMAVAGVLLLRGAPRATTSQRIDAAVLAGADLRALLEPLTALGAEADMRLVGELRAAGVHPAPPTLETEADTVRLVYAAPARLAALGERTLREVALTVQVRHPPGLAVPALAAVPATAPALHPLLAKWRVSADAEQATRRADPSSSARE